MIQGQTAINISPALRQRKKVCPYLLIQIEALFATDEAGC